MMTCEKTPSALWVGMSGKKLTTDIVTDFLLENTDFLDGFLKTHVSLERLEKVFRKKLQNTYVPETDGMLSYKPSVIQPEYATLDTGELVHRLIYEDNETTLSDELKKLSHILARVIQADDFSVYVPVRNGEELDFYDKRGKRVPYGPIGNNMTVAAHVAKERKAVMINNLQQDWRFPFGIGKRNYGADSVICIPVVPPNNLTAVLEFTRDAFKEEFELGHLQIVNALAAWVSAYLHISEKQKRHFSQNSLNDFLLETTRAMFDDLACVEQLIARIMKFAKDMVNADLCTFFMLDEERNELIGQSLKETDEEITLSTKPEIRCPIGKGVAGYVARTGKILNVPFAYNDSRFYSEVDKQTGYVTRSILCMPIYAKDKVIGVVEMLNSKVQKSFTDSDESAFKSFSAYCAIALRYSKLYKCIIKNQDQIAVAMEMLQFHQQCPEDMYQKLIKSPILPVDQIPLNFDSFKFSCQDYDSVLPQMYNYMMIKLFGEECFDINKLCRFILTVKKNYRPIRYHNWKHAFQVSHTCYCIIRKAPQYFTEPEKQALMIACICHDLDHRGYSNTFFTKLNHPMAVLYSTSVMEEHHFKQTVSILKQEGHDILNHLNPEELENMLKLIRHAILATDLSLYFENKRSIDRLLKENQLDLNNEEYRKNLRALVMTGSDLCAVAKPWQYQLDTVTDIYEEFYIQGDEEKKLGFEPIPIMDREKRDEMPKQQVGFIQFVCLPLYSTLNQMMPETKPLLDGCRSNLDKWNVVVSKSEKKHKLTLVPSPKHRKLVVTHSLCACRQSEMKVERLLLSKHNHHGEKWTLGKGKYLSPEKDPGFVSSNSVEASMNKEEEDRKEHIEKKFKMDKQQLLEINKRQINKENSHAASHQSQKFTVQQN